jgi:hypothetical protein
MRLIVDLKSPPTRKELEDCIDVMLASTPMMILAIEQGTAPFDPSFVSRQHRVFSYIKANMHRLTEGMNT